MPRLLAVGLCIIVTLAALTVHRANAQEPPLVFAETGYAVAAPLQDLWSQGGVVLYGYPISPLISERSADDGRIRAVQYFERARFEIHLEGDHSVIRLGRLGVELLPPAPAHLTAPPSDDCRFFAATGQSLCGPFAQFWARHGGLSRFGYPLAPPQLVTGADGLVREVQYTERARFERVPGGQEVQLGLLGRERYAGAGVAAAPPVTTPLTPEEARVVELVNAARIAAGLAPLRLAAELHTAAQAHSWDMALTGTISHTGSDGRGPAERMRDAGYGWLRCGENIAVGQPTPEEAVAFWLNSPPHRANMLDPAMGEIGVGYVHQATGYGHYWTINLGVR
jgi:uncharacterized protein YkwD